MNSLITRKKDVSNSSNTGRVCRLASRWRPVTHVLEVSSIIRADSILIFSDSMKTDHQTEQKHVLELCSTLREGQYETIDAFSKIQVSRCKTYVSIVVSIKLSLVSGHLILGNLVKKKLFCRGSKLAILIFHTHIFYVGKILMNAQHVRKSPLSDTF